MNTSDLSSAQWRFFVCVFSACLFLASGCGKAAIFQASPTSVVKDFIDHANAGRYSEAQEMLTDDAKAAVSGMLGQLSGGWKGMCDRSTRNGMVFFSTVLSAGWGRELLFG
jgi:hypothetical protein